MRRSGCARSAPDAFLATLLPKQFADIDEWQTQMQLKSMRAGRVQLYTTGLGNDEPCAHRRGSRSRRSKKALGRGSSRRRRQRSLAVIPEGPYVVPVVA